MADTTIQMIIDAAKFLLPAILLPLIIIWLNNRHARKLKKSEQDFELNKLTAQKSVDTKYTVDEERRVHEKEVYASVIKILFEVQKLHIDLSGNCVDYRCIDTAVSNFKLSLSKYQEKISDNQIYLTPLATNQLYGFYQKIGDLLIELKEIQDKKMFHLAIASVYFRARELAMIPIVLKKLFDTPDFELQLKDDAQIEDEQFDKLVKENYNFINCCGSAPGKPTIAEYIEFNPEEAGMISKFEELHQEMENHEVANA